MNLRIFDTFDDLVTATARTLVDRLRPGAAIAISGGSTPKRLYELLGAAPWREQMERVPVTWVVVDERYVPPDDPQSNASMIERTLFANGLPEGHRFLRFRTELGDPAATARAFEEEWRTLGLHTLDVVLLGAGEDGHTASLFPGTSTVDVEDRLATEVYVPRLEQWRVTITKPVIRAAALRLVLLSGASKAAVVRDVRQGVPHPVALATAGVETWWMVDRAAAGLASALPPAGAWPDSG